MASVLKVDKLDPQSGTALEIGTSGDTVTVPTGAGLTVVDEVKTNKISPATGTAFALGDSGDTFTVPSGATIVNSGTATGFGGGKVLQITHSTDNTAISQGVNTEYSEISTAITPAATSSKVIVMVTLGLVSGSATLDLGWDIQRDTTVLQAGTGGDGTYSNCTFGGSLNLTTGTAVNASGILVDSPSTTSAVTYKVYLRPNTGSMVVNKRGSDSAVRTSSTMTLMEIGA
jgi:hypothetical protein